MPDRMEQVETELAPVATTPVNRDFAPIAYAFDVLLWSAQFKSGYAAWFRAAEHVSFAARCGRFGVRCSSSVRRCWHFCRDVTAGNAPPQARAWPRRDSR